VNRPGWGHVAFQVPDVGAALEAVVAHGGARFGEVVTLQTTDGRRVTWCYAQDPAANLVELQAWSEESRVTVERSFGSPRPATRG
jgi:hypothetical protein